MHLLDQNLNKVGLIISRTFSDDGKIIGGALLEVDKAYDKLEEMLKYVIPALKGAESSINTYTIKRRIGEIKQNVEVVWHRSVKVMLQKMLLCKESVMKTIHLCHPPVQTPDLTGTSTPINEQILI